MEEVYTFSDVFFVEFEGGLNIVALLYDSNIIAFVGTKSNNEHKENQVTLLLIVFFFRSKFGMTLKEELSVLMNLREPLKMLS